MGILSSHRWRRRLVWIAGALVFVVALVAAILSLPEHGRRFTETFSNEPSQVVVNEKPVPVTPAMRRQVDATLVPFVATAVTRKDPVAAWDLATAAMKAGTTRADWARGDLPVLPYPAIPAQARSWTVLSSVKNDLVADLVFQPPKGSKRGPVEFNVELKAIGSGAARRWLIDSFIAIRTYDTSGASKPKPIKPAPAIVKPHYPKGRLSPAWFFVPGVLLGLLVLVPVGIGVVNWRRGVRAERAYREGRGP
ncbi:MAG: hypothetical protein ABI948_11080 [Thermoleophilia bacterium]